MINDEIKCGNIDRHRMQNHIVVYSGGYDSTLILYSLLRQAKNKNRSNISALSIVFDMIGSEKNQTEEFYRSKFADYCAKQKMDFSQMKLDIKSSANIGGIVGNGIIQQPIWAMQAILFAPNNSCLYFGFHRGDDFFLYLNDFKDYVQKACSIIGKDMLIKFPLMTMPKHEIVDEIDRYGLTDLVSTCERPNGYQPCGHCTPCINLETARTIIINRRKNDRNQNKGFVDVFQFEECEDEEEKRAKACNPISAQLKTMDKLESGYDSSEINPDEVLKDIRGEKK